MPDREKLLKAIEFCRDNASCVGCPYDRECGTRDNAIEDDTLALLREQEPVKPIFDKEDVGGRCGVCGHALTHQSMVADVFVDEWYQYCPTCGRKVKWDG